MAGRKRPSTESGATTRASKAAKTGNGETTASKSTKGGRKGAKATLPPSAFKSKALPLHMNITHTPPVIASDESTPAASADPGFIGSATLLPSVFSTGSYGWKGSKRVTIELQNSESGEPEKVQVMITMNATVLGSKQAKEEGEGEEKEEEAAEKTADEDTAGEAEEKGAE